MTGPSVRSKGWRRAGMSLQVGPVIAEGSRDYESVRL